MQVLIGLILGLTLGGLGVWLALQSRIQTAREKAKADIAADRASIVEQMRGKDLQIQELKSILKDLHVQQEQGRQEIRQEATQRAAAEAQAQRVPELERLLKEREAQITQGQRENGNLKAQLAEIHTRLLNEQKTSREKIAILDDAQQKLADAFKALSAEALRQNNQSFMELAQTSLAQFHERAQGELSLRQQAIDQVVQPLKLSLEKVDGKLQELESARVSAYATLTEQLKSLATSQYQLQSETANLVKALRAPAVRGRWGEIQLKRVVEMAGMLEYCDFTEQTSVETENGRRRPDMVIKLPNNRNIIVDSKTPLQAYLEAIEAQDDVTRVEKLKEHARQVRTHLSQLGNKAYWEQFDSAPEFAVMFLPGETFFSAALEQDPRLIEYGVNQSVILATPTTLIALLKAIAYGWRQEKMAENAQMVSALGSELYERVRTLTGHLIKLRKGLDTSVRAFNSTVGSMESRVLVTARKFRDLGAASGADIEDIGGIEVTPRALQSVLVDSLKEPDEV